MHISRSPDQFSSNRETCLLPELTPEALAEQQLMMVNQDPPEHTRLRSLVNRGFTPRMIGAPHREDPDLLREDRRPRDRGR
nr:hypothetical protein [Parafrankia sp. CH37]